MIMPVEVLKGADFFCIGPKACLILSYIPLMLPVSVLSVCESRAEANNHWSIFWQPVGLGYEQLEELASCTH